MSVDRKGVYFSRIEHYQVIVFVVKYYYGILCQIVVYFLGWISCSLKSNRTLPDHISLEIREPIRLFFINVIFTTLIKPGIPFYFLKVYIPECGNKFIN